MENERNGVATSRRNRAALGLSVLLFVPIGCLGGPAPSTESAFTETAPAASPGTVPCAVKGAAVTATTGKVTANNASRVDAYDTAVGGYGGANALGGGTVRAATTIVENGGQLTGSKVPFSPTSYGPITVPTGAKNLPLGAGAPGDVNVNGGSTLTLAPGNYVVKNLTINYPGKLVLSPVGQVNVYVTGTLNLGGVENLNGNPKNLTFFVKNAGFVNVNASGRLYGSIIAPQAVVNVNSVIFGSVLGSQVTLNSGAAVHFDQAQRCPAPPIAVTPPRTLPLPPKEKGCYLGTANGWAPVNCTTNGQLSDDIDLPVPTIQSFANPAVIPLEYGEVDITFATFGKLSDNGAPRDAMTVQANTNFWNKSDGKQGWVQFVVHAFRTTDPVNDSESAVCIWDFVDSHFPLDYFVTCVGGSTHENDNADLRHLSRRNGSFQQFDFATVGGSSFVVDGQARLGMVTRLSWFDPAEDPGNDRGLYAVVVEDRSGLHGNWTDIGGTVFSATSNGTALFTDTSVVTRTLAGSCANVPGPKPEIPWPGLCPTQPPLLPSTRLADTNPTAETNNLMLVGQPMSLAAVTPDLVFTQFLSSTDGACQAGAERVYVKDHPSDTGVVPSNADGQPFWQSPDLFIVPHDAVVDPNAPAPPIFITPGEMYDAYVRVNNDYSCNPVTGVKARIHLADPAALSTVWKEVTTGTEYQAPPGSPSGVSVPAGSHALVGPFAFTAPTSDLGDGHRCVLASIISTNQAAPANPLDAPGSYQVAQRNLSFAECSYPLTNATTTSGNLELTISAAGGAPGLSAGNEVSVTFFDPLGTWRDLWLPGSGTAYSVSNSGGNTTVRLGQASVTLAPVPLGAGVTIAAQGTVHLLFGEVQTTLSLGAVLRDSSNKVLVSNGGSCVRNSPSE